MFYPAWALVIAVSVTQYQGVLTDVAKKLALQLTLAALQDPERL